MEFERAIYRVYERSIDNLRENEFEGSGKFCKLIEYLVLGGCIFSFVVLMILHMSYVGSPGCLPQVLSQYAHSQNLTKFELKSDEILGIDVDYRFSTRVAAAQREQVNSLRVLYHCHNYDYTYFLLIYRLMKSIKVDEDCHLLEATSVMLASIP